MGQDCSVHGALVYKVHALSCQVVQAVQIHRLLVNEDFLSGCLHIQDCLIHDAAAVLDELAHGVEVCGQIYRCREDTFLVFSLALAVELFPPLRYIVEARLVVRQHFHGFSFSVKDVADSRILHGIIFFKRFVQRKLSSGCRALHQLLNVCAADCDGQKSYSCQHGETASHIVRHNEGLVALLCSQVLQGSPCLVRGGVNPLGRFLFAVFLLQHLLEYAEGDGRLCGRSGLGDDIYGEISVADHVDEPLQIGAADAVSCIVDLRCLADLFGYIVVEAVAQELDGSSCSQVGAADTDDDQYLGVALNLLCRLLDTRELFFIVIYREIYPANIVVAGSCSAHQDVLGVSYDLFHGVYFMLFDKCHCL